MSKKPELKKVEFHNLVALRETGYGCASMRNFIRANINMMNAPCDRRDHHRYLQTMCVPYEGESMLMREVLRKIVKKYGKRTWEAFNAAYDTHYLVAQVGWPELYKAYEGRSEKGWFDVTWHGAGWVTLPHDLQMLHKPHVSEDDPTQIAYTPDLKHLLADRQVRCKPGRYLAKFYSEILSESEIKYWAEKQVSYAQPAELKMVTNTDPDGWVWVYENGPISCMRYNRERRFLNSGLYGVDHPVRAYAHLENDLALAYIMKPGEDFDMSTSCHRDDSVVAARVIINTEAKVYGKIYFEEDMQRATLRSLLEAQGYREGEPLKDQVLVLMTYEGDTLCPYLDLGYTEVDIYGDYMRVVSSGEFDGQNSTGVIEDANRCTCPICGDRCDEDNMTYIEARGESICEDCRDHYYTWAWVSRYEQDYVHDRDVVTVKGEEYHPDALSDHDIYECAYCGKYMHIDDLTELEDEDMVCHCHAGECDATGEMHMKSSLVSTDYDGDVFEDYVVRTYPNEGYAWKEKCYTIDTPNGRLYVHEEDMSALTELFGREGDMLVPRSLLTLPIYADFVPTNVLEGDECASVTDVIELRGVDVPDDEDEDEFEVIPFVGSMNMNEEVRA